MTPEEHDAEVERLRKRTDIYGWDPPEMTPDFLAALERCLRGERILDSRPEPKR
jgi:hypothetical protein